MCNQGTEEIKMKMEARLLEMGYKIWERTDCNGKHYKRIYINDFSKYLDIEDKGIDKSGVQYLVVDGIDFSGLKRQAKKTIVNQIKNNGFKVWYNCETEKFSFESTDYEISDEIVRSGIDNLKKELEKKEEQIEETKEEEKMTKEEIKQEIILDLEKAWENTNEASYWLEKLPMSGDYDEAVHDCTNSLKFAITKSDREYFDASIEDLIEHYYINQKNYKF
jgi:hypothetical protein